MARMVPPSPGIGHIDPTEQLIFDRIKEETPDTWVGLHHVGLPRHRTKPIAEIDFIVISEHGVFCLEVKGGAVRCEAGTWYAGTRQLSESPFQQVGSASSDLRNCVDQLHPFVFGYGCVFPHCVFDVHGPEILPEVVYDASSVKAGFAEYVRQLGEYWGARYQHAKRLGATDISRISHALRPDFEAAESVLHRIDEVRKQLVAFTAEQQRALEGLRENKQVVVKGGAGTGKTLIAATEAVRLADHGHRTLLTCFTKALAAKLREGLGARPNLEVCHIDQLVSDLIDSGGTAGTIPDDVSEADRLEVYRPLAALEGAERAGTLNAFDAVVIDEGQDLLTESKLHVINGLLKGGLANGVWRAFWDQNQALFAPGVVGNPRLLSDMGGAPTTFALTVNCRNTRPIADRTQVLSDIPADEVAFVDGPPVVDRHWDGEKTQIKRLRQIVLDWLGDGVPADTMVILSPRRFERSVASRDLRLPVEVRDYSGRLFSPGPNELAFSTISSFKGLEADAVLLVDVDDLTSAHHRALMYVGASRARALLAVLRSQETTEIFATRVAQSAVRGPSEAERSLVTVL